MAKMKWTFAEWMNEVDRIVEALVGLSWSDLEDFGWRDAFDKGWSEDRAARAALKASGF